MPLTSTRRTISIALAVALVALAGLGLAALGSAYSIAGLVGEVVVVGVVVAAAAYLVAAASSVQHDVEASARVERALRQSEARMAGLVSIAADAIITVDASQRVTLFNHGAEEIFGYTASEMLGHHLSELLPERLRNVHASHFAAFGGAQEAARRMGERREILGLRKSGEEFPADASILKLEVGGEMAFTVVLRDVTARKQVEEGQRFLADAGGVLTQSLDFDDVLTAVAQLPVPRLGDVCVLDILREDLQRRVVSVSGDPAVAERMRFIGDEPPGPDSASEVHDVMRTREPLLVEEVGAEWIEAHAETDAVLERAQRLGTRSMIMVPLLARGDAFGVMSVLRLTDGPAFTTGDLALAEQLATRAAFALDNARLFQTARSATAARDDILGVVSHDLRNPVNAIGMCVRVLRESPPAEASARRDLVDAIGDAVDWMDRLIRDLLDVANLERGRLSVERHREEVEPIVQSALGMFEHAARTRSISLVQGAIEPGLRVHGDAGRLVQVLSNLISNSLAHTEAGGSVQVTAVRAGTDVRFDVRDSGSGIPSEHLPHIFERHWRSSASAKRGGSGLGLAIARGIVHAHDGRIEVESVPGEGACFHFTIPSAEGSVSRDP